MVRVSFVHLNQEVRLGRRRFGSSLRHAQNAFSKVSSVEATYLMVPSNGWPRGKWMVSWTMKWTVKWTTTVGTYLVGSSSLLLTAVHDLPLFFEFFG